MTALSYRRRTVPTSSVPTLWTAITRVGKFDLLQTARATILRLPRSRRRNSKMTHAPLFWLGDRLSDASLVPSRELEALAWEVDKALARQSDEAGDALGRKTISDPVERS